MRLEWRPGPRPRRSRSHRLPQVSLAPHRPIRCVHKLKKAAVHRPLRVRNSLRFSCPCSRKRPRLQRPVRRVARRPRREAQRVDITPRARRRLLLVASVIGPRCRPPLAPLKTPTTELCRAPRRSRSRFRFRFRLRLKPQAHLCIMHHLRRPPALRRRHPSRSWHPAYASL
jgi:hypothetical protein